MCALCMCYCLRHSIRSTFLFYCHLNSFSFPDTTQRMKKRKKTSATASAAPTSTPFPPFISARECVTSTESYLEQVLSSAKDSALPPLHLLVHWTKVLSEEVGKGR